MADRTTITDPEFAEIAQMIQRRTGCGGLTSNDVTAAVMLMLGITECEGRKIDQPEFRHDYLPGAAEEALRAIRKITMETHLDGPGRERPYTALSMIDQIARKGIA